MILTLDVVPKPGAIVIADLLLENENGSGSEIETGKGRERGTENESVSVSVTTAVTGRGIKAASVSANETIGRGSVATILTISTAVATMTADTTEIIVIVQTRESLPGNLPTTENESTENLPVIAITTRETPSGGNHTLLAAVLNPVMNPDLTAGRRVGRKAGHTVDLKCGSRLLRRPKRGRSWRSA